MQGASAAVFTTQDILRGATVIQVTDVSTIQNGDTLTISDSTHSETTTVASVLASAGRMRRATAGVVTLANALAHSYGAGARIVTAAAETLGDEPAAAATPPASTTATSQSAILSGADAGASKVVDPAIIGGSIAAGTLLMLLVGVLVYAVYYVRVNVEGISEELDADRRASMGYLTQHGAGGLGSGRSFHYHPGGSVTGADGGAIRQLDLLGGSQESLHYWPGASLAGTSIPRRPSRTQQTALSVARLQRAHTHGFGGGGSIRNSIGPIEEDWVLHDNQYRDVAAQDEFSEAQDEYIGVMNQLEGESKQV